MAPRIGVILRVRKLTLLSGAVLVALVAIGCSGAATGGGGLPSPTPDIPMLTEEDVLGLAFTRMSMSGKVTIAFCLLEVESQSATYKGDGTWIAKYGGCTLVVDDSTGKVTGP